MKKHKGKTKRWFAGILSAVLVIGSINLVDALEGSNGESALYDAPELTITQGAETYDLKEGITYDSSLYELAVVNDGGFDVNTVGDYEVTYSLTSKDDGTLDPGDSGNGEVKDPDDTKDPTDTEDSKNENGSSESGDASNSDNENKDQNSGDNQGGDNTQTGDNSDNAGSDNGSDSSDSSNTGDSADAGQGDTNSDSSNTGDSADAGQGDTNSDSSNAGDSADAGQEDTNSDSSNAEDTADAVSGEDAVQSEENTVDTGVLGVSRSRTAVNMSYQSEPVGAEAVDVTEGDDTNTVDTQEKQVITFQRTVTVKAAVEENALYEAPDLYLELGQEAYDLMEGIIYDKDLYEVKVSDLGDFDINMVGEYEVTYVLDCIGKSAKGEDTKTSKQEETTVSDEQKSEDNDGTQAATLELSDEKQSVESSDDGTASSMEEKSPEVKTTSQEAVYFTRNVFVEESGVNYSFRNAVAYANVQGNYVVKLGTPVWTDETHTKFQYTNVKIDTEGDDISLMTITLSTGKLSDEILKDADVKDDYGKSATWFFGNKKTSQEIEEKIKSMVFNYVNAMNVYVSINGNDNEGFAKGLDRMKLTQWSVNGHYYLYVDGKHSWTAAYNLAKDFRLAGQRGYLATITSNEELTYILGLQTGQTWTSGTRLVLKDNSLINDVRFDRIERGIVKYGTDYYWAAGPETGSKIESLWGSGEPNNAPINYNALNGTISDVQNQESCVMVRNTSIKTLNDIIEGNVPGDTDLTVGGVFCEFGGYADGDDPGQPDNSKKGEVNVVAAPMDAEASINGVKYAPLADALELAEDGDKVEIVKDTVTAVTNGTLKTGVKLVSYDNNTTYTVPADINGTNIDVSDTGAITLRSGVVTVSNTDANERKITVNGYVLTSTADYTVKAVDTSNDTTLGDSQASVTLKAIGDTFTAVKNGATYTYTATKDNQTFYLGEYSAVLNWDERSGVAALASIGSPEFPAELVKPQTQPNNPYHQLTLYTVTIKPREDYSIDVDKVWVSMGVDAQGEPQIWMLPNLLNQRIRIPVSLR